MTLVGVLPKHYINKLSYLILWHIGLHPCWCWALEPSSTLHHADGEWVLVKEGVGKQVHECALLWDRDLPGPTTLTSCLSQILVEDSQQLFLIVNMGGHLVPPSNLPCTCPWPPPGPLNSLSLTGSSLMGVWWPGSQPLQSVGSGGTFPSAFSSLSSSLQEVLWSRCTKGNNPNSCCWITLQPRCSLHNSSRKSCRLKTCSITHFFEHPLWWANYFHLFT